ncbi:TetR/AcrR family transcriptional regulator C-terminal domain-containing protein [Prauserella flavalba]|uniref:TetR/AcrR family transcriptional regulator C-terminal domain-containing protein n=1 Tax=Prauserella flavalba TaxID=1477506 RepID=UPI001FECB562|nr:TetR/AcrR family transcriptional regulator C-terminal domain-containing protein [Prauserella flavalba]
MAALRADRVVREALELVDAGGLESLTMRRLATSLGAHLPTIYRLFDNKDALIDELAEAILGRALTNAGPDTPDWTDRVRNLATGLRSALLSQRDGARIVGGNYAAKRNNLTYIDTLVGCMQDAGFTRERALWATSSVFCFVLGEALEQQGASGGEAGTLTDVLRADEHPHLRASPAERLLDFDARFDFGLELLLDGMRSQLKAAKAATNRTAPRKDRGRVRTRR